MQVSRRRHGARLSALVVVSTLFVGSAGVGAARARVPATSASAPLRGPVVTVHPRSVTLTLSGNLTAKGTVWAVDGYTPCFSGVTVTIQRRRPNGSWGSVRTTTTDAGGVYQAGVPDAPGSYSALVRRAENTIDACTRDRSELRRYTGVATPELLTPIDDEAVQQNDPDIGCPFDSTRGFGFRISFDWSDPSAEAAIAGYQVFAERVGAATPLVDTFVTDSQLTLTECNAFVADQNLDVWRWRVRAVDVLGNESAWAAFGQFRFEPCRIDGMTCSA